MAAYIAAVAGVFTSVGLTKVWGEKYERKLPGPDGKLGTPDDIVVNVPDETWTKIAQELISKKHEEEMNCDDDMPSSEDTSSSI